MGGTLKEKIGTPAPPKIRKITYVRAKSALKFRFLGKKGSKVPRDQRFSFDFLRLLNTTLYFFFRERPLASGGPSTPADPAVAGRRRPKGGVRRALGGALGGSKRIEN